MPLLVDGARAFVDSSGILRHAAQSGSAQWSRQVPRLEAGCMPPLAPLTRRLVYRAYRVSDASALRSRASMHGCATAERCW